MRSIESSDLKLIPLQKKNIEILRIWRNNPEVKSKMIFQEDITFQDQLEWFSKLDNTQHYYELYYKQALIGNLNVKNIDWEKRNGEAGILIGDSNFKSSPIAILAIVMMMNYYFSTLNFSKLHIKVRKDNEQGLLLNKSLGYQITNSATTYFSLSIDVVTFFEKNEKFLGLIG